MGVSKPEKPAGNLLQQSTLIQVTKQRLTGSTTSTKTHFVVTHLPTMVLCEDGECSVCLQPYSRDDRIPRMLHCRHTFCDPCLETISQVRSRLLHVSCPLCRRVTCVDRSLSLQEALWVNSSVWDQIPEDVHREAEENELKGEAEEEERAEPKHQPSGQAEGVSMRSSRTKLKLPAFFRKFSLMKQHQESIIPGTNVEMKSWRRIPTEETL